MAYRKFSLLMLAASLCAGLLSSCGGAKGPGMSALADATDSISYALGADIARQLSSGNKVDINPAVIGLAFRDYKAGTPKVNEAFINQFMSRFGQMVQQGKVKKVRPDKFISVAGKDNLETVTDTFSYCLGLNGAAQYSRDSIVVNPVALEQALWDFESKKMLIEEKDVRGKIEQIYGAINAKKNAKRIAMIEENKQRGKAWLAENKTKPGVKELPGGLQYKEIKAGTGISPTIKDRVTIHYRGTLINGEEFDSSISRGEPATFNLGQLIQAWQVALPMMKEGAKWELYVPSEMGYGEVGSGEKIGPNETLIFEIELFKVIKQ